MKMKTIGDKTREYRRKADMTQEKLASAMNVTFQTVSKWETGVASPDLSLIVPLARLFHVSTDELLGVNETEPDKRYTELEESYKRTFHTEDLAKRQNICETAVREYPGDMRWLSDLAWVISNRSHGYEDQEQRAGEQEKAIRLFDSVIRNCKDEILRGDAIDGITQLLGWRGRKEEAKRYAEMLPERSVRTRDHVMENCLEGEELILFKQKRIEGHLHGILWDLYLLAPYLPDLPDYDFTDQIRDLTRVMIPDGNYLLFNHDLYHAVRKRINREMKKGPIADKTLIYALLDEMEGYAGDYDRIVFDEPGEYRYTSPVFDRIKEDTREWLGNGGEPMKQDFERFSKEIRDKLVQTDLSEGNPAKE